MTVYVVIPKPAARIDLNISQATLTSVGQSLQLNALVYDIDGVAIPDAQVAWSSSHPTVATVSDNGLVSAVSNGTTLVTATSGGVFTVATIHVVIEGTVPPPPPPPPPEPSTDRDALIALYNATDGPNWTVSTNWLSSGPLGERYGVDTNTNGRVTRISMEGNGLSGTLPQGLDQLAYLIELHLDHNALSGGIPADLGLVNSLERLSLEDNDLTDTIPVELGQLNNLGVLNLNDNKLSGPIPTELGRLPSLWILDLSNNELSGSIPPELEQLENLMHLRLPYNKLTGSIPVELGELTNLRSLQLQWNNLTGGIPVELAQLVELQHLNLEVNELIGSIPPELGQLTNLENLVLNVNKLTGSIPPELGGLTDLRLLGLGGNELTGNIPPDLGRLTNLEDLNLSYNTLEGEVPSELGNLSALKRLDLQVNIGLTGPLPLSLTNVKLDYLSLENTGLCVPTDAVFQTWLDGIEDREGITFCEDLSDRDVLIALYNATDGPNWERNANWLSDEPLHTWQSVKTDAAGRVTELNLNINQMTGILPAGHKSARSA